MDRNSIYYKQVQLLMQVLPFVAKQSCFALKGGTAINLFVRELPRLSVDIDLVYLPMRDREGALQDISEALDRQHPRDLIDVKWLLENEGITDEIRKALLVYLASHNRPIAELGERKREWVFVPG